MVSQKCTNAAEIEEVTLGHVLIRLWLLWVPAGRCKRMHFLP